MATLVIAGQEFNFNEGLGMANMIDMIRAIALLAKQNPSASITVKDDGVAVGGSLSSLDFRGSGVSVTCDEQGNTVVTVASGGASSDEYVDLTSNQVIRGIKFHEDLVIVPMLDPGVNGPEAASTSYVVARIAQDAAPIDHVGAGDTAHAVATQSVAGFMSAEDKAKLDGLQEGSTGTGTGGDYAHPTGDGNLHVPATGTTSNMKVLVAGDAPGSAQWKTLDLTYMPSVSFKQNVVIATTGNLNAAFANNKLTDVGTYTQFQQDGATLIAGSRVLVKDQTDATENGIYELIDAGSSSTPWVMTRATDADTAFKLSGAIVSVDAGLVNAGKCFISDFRYTDSINVAPVYWGAVMDTRMASSKPASASGVAAPGVSTNYAREDHVHSVQSTLVASESVKPVSDNNLSLGSAVARWSVVYAGTGVINTSDAREKQQVRELFDAERAVAIRLKSLVRAFKFNDAVEQKGNGARIHVGVIAQDVKSAFEAEGLVAEDYSILCYDEWDAELDENGNVVKPAGNRYGVRYEELLAFIISAM